MKRKKKCDCGCGKDLHMPDMSLYFKIKNRNLFCPVCRTFGQKCMITTTSLSEYLAVSVECSSSHRIAHYIVSHKDYKWLKVSLQHLMDMVQKECDDES